MLHKIDKNKKVAPRLIIFNEIFFRKIQRIFDVENWLWKSEFGIFWHCNYSFIWHLRVTIKQLSKVFQKYKSSKKWQSNKKQKIMQNWFLTKDLLPVDPCPQNPTIEVMLMYVNLKALLHTLVFTFLKLRQTCFFAKPVQTLQTT